MDMQNVSNLTIPEGQVRTIHDKDSRLIWGRVAYNTKYAGDTFQQTYSGKNLFNYQGVVNLAIATTIAGRPNYRGYYIQANAGDTFTLSRATTTGNNRFRVCFTMVEPARGVDAYNENGVVERYISADDATEVSFTVPQDMHYVFIYLDNSGQDITESLKIQLETGSTATAYEPYVGGIPAPNPDYPQTVQVVAGEQTVTVTGKNKIDGSYSEIIQMVRCSAEASGNGFKITSTSSSGATYVTVPIPNIAELLGKTVTVSYVATGSGVRVRFFYYNSSWAATDSIGNSETVTLPNSIDGYAGIGVVFYTSNGSSATYTDIQLEIGSTTTDYQPYQSQSYPISLGSTELCKIGDYQDYIYKSGDDWYVHKETGKIDLTNTSGWWASGPHTIKNSLTNLGISNIHTVGVGRKTDALCNYFTAYPSLNLYQGTDTVGFGISDGFYFSNNDWSLGDFNTFKSNNQILVCYELNTPTDTKITDATLITQLNAVHGWLTRYGYESTVSGDLPIVLQRDSLQ